MAVVGEVPATAEGGLREVAAEPHWVVEHDRKKEVVGEDFEIEVVAVVGRTEVGDYSPEEHSLDDNFEQTKERGLVAGSYAEGAADTAAAHAVDVVRAAIDPEGGCP